ncbi:MAG: hypothetical protein JHC98_05350 [Thermoleophilaceae bacterium]|nr:hypothetical protein [Thermoleophilaceae bacterium]
MRLLRKHLTYANVMSSLAIFLLLGGTAFAAGKFSGSRLKDKSVSGKKLKTGSVSNSKLRSNAVTNAKIQAASIYGSRIASNALTDREINMAKLGKISKASTADNAGKVDNKDAAQLTVKCPSGTVDLGAYCAENGTRSSATGYAAAKACTQAGGYLPDAAALIGAEDAGKISIGGSEWSSSWSYGANPEGAIVTSSGITTAANPSSSVYGYRCFFSLRER